MRFSLVEWDGTPKGLSRGKPTNGVLTIDGRVLVWKEDGIHHGTVLEHIGDLNAASLTIELSSRKIKVDYPREAHTHYREFMSRKRDISKWVKYLLTDLEYLFKEDAEYLESMYEDWEVVTRAEEEQGVVV